MTRISRRSFIVSSAVAIPAIAASQVAPAYAKEQPLAPVAGQTLEPSVSLQLLENPEAVKVGNLSLTQLAQSLVISNNGGTSWPVGTQLKISANLLDETGFVDQSFVVLQAQADQNLLVPISFKKGDTLLALNQNLAPGESLTVPLSWKQGSQGNLAAGQEIQIHASMVIDQSKENYYEVSSGELVAKCL